MERFDVIQVGGGQVELLQGDLTDIPSPFAVDLLIVSAFPNNYVPTPNSLIGALYRKGLSVDTLARDKAEDLRESFSCWTSRTIARTHPGLRFSRILCFEPLARGDPPELVGDIFRALVPVLAQDPTIRSIAMPILAAGEQHWPTEVMLEPMVDAATHWLGAGLPLDVIRIVAYSTDDLAAAKAVFAEAKSQLTAGSATRGATEPGAAAPGEDEEIEFDVFLSYAHEDATAAELFEEELLRQRPGLRLFFDRKSLKTGSAWQPEIFESLDHCHRVVAMLSPSYLASRVCKEEFNIAWVRGREADEDVLFPLYLLTAALPTYMKYRQYADCRELDLVKLAGAAAELVALLPQPTG